MKPLVIYHKDCIDGFAAAFAAWLKFDNEAEYVSMQHDAYEFKAESGEFDTEDGVIPVFGREIYILDFSFPRSVMNKLVSCTKRVVWLDHHKTSFEMLSRSEQDIYTEDRDNLYIRLDNNRSGALLAWDFFRPHLSAPMVFLHIDDYDRWQFKLDGTKEIVKAIWSYAPWSFEQWYSWKLHHEGIPVEYWNFLSDGKAILRAHDAAVQSVVDKCAVPCLIPGYGTNPDGSVVWKEHHGLMANCLPHLQSDVGHELAKRSGTYGLLWHVNKDGKCLCSLRSVENYDVSTIAKFFGGGGHKNAAGFIVDIQHLLMWMKA